MTKEETLFKGWIDLQTTDMEMTLRTRRSSSEAFEPTTGRGDCGDFIDIWIWTPGSPFENTCSMPG
jgi:hypothetical protein